MSIEAHVTVAFGPNAEPAFLGWLSSRALRLTTIELAKGISPRQTMITTYFAGKPDDALREAHELRRSLVPLNVDVVRIKLEVAHTLTSATLPALYIEHHVKVRLAPGRLETLAGVARAHGAHPSRSARRTQIDHEERFLTQRFAPGASQTSADGLTALLESLAVASVDVIKVERERVVHDDNLQLDAGWEGDRSP